MNDFKEVLGIVIIPIIITFSLIFTLVVIPLYISSGKQAKIYNEKNNTNYTASDFFWASDQINQSTNTLKIEGIK